MTAGRVWHLVGSFLQLLAQEGGLPEVATKSSGVFSSIVIVKDGALLSDTGESRLVPPAPQPMAPYDAKELGLVRASRVGFLRRVAYVYNTALGGHL